MKHMLLGLFAAVAKSIRCRTNRSKAPEPQRSGQDNNTTELRPQGKLGITTFYMPEEALATLERIARMTGQPVASVVAAAIRDYDRLPTEERGHVAWLTLVG